MDSARQGAGDVETGVCGAGLHHGLRQRPRSRRPRRRCSTPGTRSSSTSETKTDAAPSTTSFGRGAVVGDLSSLDQTRDIARDVNRFGPMDAVIHNAGVYSGPHVMPVNIVAPYLLTALIERPKRLIYLSSGMHRSGRPDLAVTDLSGHRSGSYSDSKLFVATLAAAIDRLWPAVVSNAVDPGWVPTRMGGPGAPTTCGSDT